MQKDPGAEDCVTKALDNFESSVRDTDCEESAEPPGCCWAGDIPILIMGTVFKTTMKVTHKSK